MEGISESELVEYLKGIEKGLEDVNEDLGKICEKINQENIRNKAYIEGDNIEKKLIEEHIQYLENRIKELEEEYKKGILSVPRHPGTYPYNVLDLPGSEIDKKQQEIKTMMEIRYQDFWKRKEEISRKIKELKKELKKRYEEIQSREENKN